jgi:hypothetical protein
MNKSKFNWGTGILITIILFMIITVATVVFLMNEDVDLVESDYYAKGIDHQKQIERVNRTNSMDDEVSIDQEMEYIRLSFPDSYQKKNINGTIQFYRPSDSKKDLTVPVTIDSNAQQVIPISSLDRGYWKIKLNWNADSKEYYKESSFVIN